MKGKKEKKPALHENVLYILSCLYDVGTSITALMLPALY